MNILAIETSSVACSVALQFNGQRHSQHKIAPMQQTNLLLPMIDEVLKSAGASLQQINAIAFGAGPGSFTGMRIASSVTQGLAFSANLSVIPISSLAAIAQAAHMAKPQYPSYLVAVDARMGQIYWAHYVANGTLVLLQDQEQLLLPTQVIVTKEILENSIGVGDGWNLYQDQLTQPLGFAPKALNGQQLPTAEAVLELALRKSSENNTLTPTEALPSYLITR